MKIIEATPRPPRGKIPDSLHKNYNQSVKAGVGYGFRPSFQDKLSNLGWNELGDGLYSTVYTNPKKSYVLKVNKISDLGFESFAQFVKKHPNKHFPKIGDVKKVRYSKENYYIYCIEKLYPINPYSTARSIANAIDIAFYRWDGNSVKDSFKGNGRYIKFFQQHPSLLSAIKLLVNKFGENNDIHPDNIMQRKDGTIVIIDPYAW